MPPCDPSLCDPSLPGQPPADAVSTHVRILMGTRNGARWLSAQLDSFVAQTHGDWSLWISDDGSDDDTRALLEAFARRHPGRVARLVDGPCRGSAANFLQLLCHPDLPPGFVALSDQDDVWHPRKLEWALSRLQAGGSGPGVWAARYRFTDAALRGGRVSARWGRGPSLGNALVQNILSGHTLTLNPAALALVRRAGPQAVAHHDWWIYLLMVAVGAGIICDDRVVLDYRQHGGNAMGGRVAPRVRLARGQAVLDGRLRGWMAANLRALEQAGVALDPWVTAFLRAWPQADRRGRVRLMRAFGVHRQARAETAVLYLAAALGRL